MWCFRLAEMGKIPWWTSKGKKSHWKCGVVPTSFGNLSSTTSFLLQGCIDNLSWDLLYCNFLLTLSLLRSHKQFPSLSAIQFSWCKFREFGTGSNNIPLIDIFLYSHHLSSWCCIDIVRRNSVLLNQGR